VYFGYDDAYNDSFTAGTGVFKSDGTTKFSLQNSLYGKFTGNNTIAAAYFNSASESYSGVIINFTPTLISDKGFTYGLTSYSNATGFGIDSSNNTYYGQKNSKTLGSSTSSLEIVKLNSSGTQQWKKSFYRNISGFFSTETINHVDLSGNIYLGHYYGLTKINTDGSVAWNVSVTGYATSPGLITSDSSGNVYTAWFNNTVTKHNSSGTLQWQKSFASIGTVKSISATSDGGLYVGLYNELSATAANIVKLNSDGTTGFQRYFQSSTYSNAPAFARVLATTLNDILVSYSAENTSYNYAYVARLPADGSKTGTYSVGGTTLVYATSTSTISNGSISFKALNADPILSADTNTGLFTQNFGSSGVTNSPRYTSIDVRVAIP